MEKKREKHVGVLYYGGGFINFFRELAYFIAGGYCRSSLQIHLIIVTLLFPEVSIHTQYSLDWSKYPINPNNHWIGLSLGEHSLEPPYTW